MTTTQEFKNYLVSPGSVASTYVENLFGARIESPKKSFNAHERNANLSLFNNSRVCYIFGNPYDIVLSYFRRNFLFFPYQHTTNITGDLNALCKVPSIVSESFRRPFCWFLKPEWTLDEYLELESDPFKLKEHFLNWYNNPTRKYEIMFLRYETLSENIKELCSWYNLDDGYAEKFQKKTRNSNYKNLNNIRLKKMKRLYGELFDLLESLPDLIVDP